MESATLSYAPPAPETINVLASESRSEPKQGLGVFERYLSVWVALCIVAGVAIGQVTPVIPGVLGGLAVAALIWTMIFPVMLQIDFKSIVGVRRQAKGLTVTLVTNWLIKPFTMFAFAWLLLVVMFAPLIGGNLAREYVAGAMCSASGSRSRRD